MKCSNQLWFLYKKTEISNELSISPAKNKMSALIRWWWKTVCVIQSRLIISSSARVKTLSKLEDPLIQTWLHQWTWPTRTWPGSLVMTLCNIFSLWRTCVYIYKVWIKMKWQPCCQLFRWILTNTKRHHQRENNLSSLSYVNLLLFEKSAKAIKIM